MSKTAVPTLESSILNKVEETLRKIKSQNNLFDITPGIFNSYIGAFKEDKDLLKLLTRLNDLSADAGSEDSDEDSESSNPVADFRDFCLAKCKQNFSSTQVLLSQSNQPGKERKLSNLLGKIIQLGTLDFKYSQGLVSKFDSVEYVYIDQPPDNDTKGYVPSIYYAAKLGLFSIIPSLATKGANPNARYDGHTCLDRLIECDDKNILNKIDILIRAGAKADIKSIGGLTPVKKALFFNKDQIVQHFKEKGYTPSWESTLGISSLKSLYDRLEAYIVTEYLNFKKSGKEIFIIVVGEMHGQPDSLITMMMITNICHRLGIETYYFEEKDMKLPISNKTALESSVCMSPRIAQEYGMELIKVDLAKTYSPADVEEKGMENRNNTMVDNIIKSRKISGMLHIGAAHLRGVSSRLSSFSNIYHCNINTCFGSRQKQKETAIGFKEKDIAFRYDESKCFQGYFYSNSVIDSEEIMLLLKWLISRDLQGKKLIPTLEDKGIFKKTSLKDVHLETKNVATSGCNHFFHESKKNKTHSEIKRFREYLKEIKAQFAQEQKDNNTSTYLKNLLFPEISRAKKLKIAQDIDKVLTKYGDDIEQAQAEIDQIIRDNLESVEDRWGRMNNIMQDLSVNYRGYKHNKS